MYRQLPISYAVVALLRIAGGVAVFAGGVLLAFDGYVEDTGTPPVQTWDRAIPVLGFGAALFIAAQRQLRGAGAPAAWVERSTGHSNTFWGLLILGAVVGLKVIDLLSSDALPVQIAQLLLVGVALGYLVVLLLRNRLRQPALRPPERDRDPR